MAVVRSAIVGGSPAMTAAVLTGVVINLSLDYARGADFGGDTGATVWYKRSAHNVLATTEAPA